MTDTRDSGFDQIIDRRSTNAAALEGYRNYLFDGDISLPCDDDDVIALWVADMAFASAPVAIEAMRERLEHPIFGYTAVFDDVLFDAYSDWCHLHYDWRPQRDHFVTSPGIVSALYDLVDHLVDPHGKVLTLTPSYGHFKHATDRHDVELLTVALVRADGAGFGIDWTDFEAKIADPDTRMFFLCHPHNPTGRVFADDELRRMGELCLSNDVIVVSDEIHCDLLRQGVTHTPLAKLFPDSDQIITCMSSSKTFNLAGLGLANVLIPNDEMRAIWNDRNSPLANPLSMAATTGCFTNGHEWRRELRTYLDANFEYLQSVLQARLPASQFEIPDATYLAWIDLRAYFGDDVNLTRYFAETAGVLIEGGDMFVADAEGFIRVNLACPRSVLTEAMDRIIEAVPNR